LDVDVAVDFLQGKVQGWSEKKRKREGRERARIQRRWLADLSSRVRDGCGAGRFPLSNFVVLAASQTGEIEGMKEGSLGIKL
jgi:hypothetical protein